MKRLFAIAVSSLFVLTGCAAEPEFGEVSSAIKDSQEMQTEETQSTEPGPVPNFELSTLRIDSELCKFEDQSEEFLTRKDRNVPFWMFDYFPNLQEEPTFLPSLGELEVALVFVDWQDKKGLESDHSYYMSQAQFMSDWFEVVSQGNLRINWRVSQDWSTLSGSWRDYYANNDGSISDEDRAPFEQWFLDEAVKASDESFDYSDIDYVVFAMPLSGRMGENNEEFGEVVMNFGTEGMAFDIHPRSLRQTVVYSKEKSIGNWVISGTAYQDQRGFTPAWTHWAHELGHMFGMRSHAPIPGVEEQSQYFANPMSATSLFAYSWHPVRAVSTWHSWILGWIDDSQVLCVDANDIENEVFAINNFRLLDGDTKAVIVRTGETTGLVIESREWDPDFDAPSRMAKNGFYDGVLMYYIDSSRVISDESLIPLMPHGLGQIWDENLPPWAISSSDFMFQEGESAQYEDFEIEVLTMQDGVDYVRISQIDG